MRVPIAHPWSRLARRARAFLDEQAFERARSRRTAAAPIAACLLAASLAATSCAPDELPAFANPPPDDSGVDLDDGGDARDAGGR